MGMLIHRAHGGVPNGPRDGRTDESTNEHEGGQKDDRKKAACKVQRLPELIIGQMVCLSCLLFKTTATAKLLVTVAAIAKECHLSKVAIDMTSSALP